MNPHGTKSVVITGVSTGIGNGAAAEFCRRGYRVFGSVRHGLFSHAVLARVRPEDIADVRAYAYLKSPEPAWSDALEDAYSELCQMYVLLHSHVVCFR